MSTTNNKKLLRLALKALQTDEVLHIKQQLCQIFSDKQQQRDCIQEFDKHFVKSFIAKCIA
jgi:hypothetical protein